MTDDESWKTRTDFWLQVAGFHHLMLAQVPAQTRAVQAARENGARAATLRHEVTALNPDEGEELRPLMRRERVVRLGQQRHERSGRRQLVLAQRCWTGRTRR
jgi:hypothetical protein